MKKETIRLAKPVGGAGALVVNLRHAVHKPGRGKGAWKRHSKHRKDLRRENYEGPFTFFLMRRCSLAW